MTPAKMDKSAAAPKTPRLELILPAYNEAKSLERLIERYADGATQAGLTPEQFQAVVVDNGSTDETAQVLVRLKESRLGAWYSVVTVKKNVGYGHGIFEGLSATRAPIVGYSHADEQCAPEDVFRAYEKIGSSQGPALVKGVRSGRNWKDVLVSRIFEFLATVILGLRVHEINAQPKLFPRDLLAAMKNPPPHFAFDLYALYQARKQGYDILSIPVLFPPRVHGLSRWAATMLSRAKTILGQIKCMFFSSSDGRPCLTSKPSFLTWMIRSIHIFLLGLLIKSVLLFFFGSYFLRGLFIPFID